MTDYVLRTIKTGEMTYVKLDCEPEDVAVPEGHDLMLRDGENWIVFRPPTAYDLITTGISLIESGQDYIERGIRLLEK